MLTLNPIFVDGAIFPKGKEIRVYGQSWKDVTVTFLNQTVKAERSGETYMATLAPIDEYGGPYEMVVKTEDEELVVKDIYIGEVFLMAGQSNMMFKIKEGEDDVSDGESDSLLRLFSTDHIIFFDADIDFYRRRDGWVKCQKEFIPEWSSLCYQVGRNLRENQHIAIGMIACYEGASSIESWLPQSAFEDKRLIIPDDQKHPAHFDAAYLLWNEDSRLYNLVYSQVQPYAVSGVVWYQGECDSTEGEAAIYHLELQALINAWRKDFSDEKLPVVVVQLADLDCRDDAGWHLIQAAQEKCVNMMENVYLAESKDISDSYIIHPPKKKLLAKRISNLITDALWGENK